MEGTIGALIRQRRFELGMTLKELADKSGVSQSHLGRVEIGGRFPSAAVLRKIAGPLKLQEKELLIQANYLSPGKSKPVGRIDPYVAGMLASEPIEVQRIVLGILNILKAISRGSPKS